MNIFPLGAIPRPHYARRIMDANAGPGSGPQRLDIELLYSLHLPSVLSFALRMLGDEEAAGDIAQETFIAVLRSAETFRADSSALTWILAIAKNLCLKRLKGKREKSFESIEELIEAVGPGSSDAYAEPERRFYVEEVKNGCLLGLLQCLPRAQRCAFILHLLIGLPVAEAARIMGKSQNSLRILLSRARAGMRGFLCRNCSRIDVGNKCSCANLIEFSLKHDLIEKYRPSIGIPEIKDELRSFADEVELFRSLPEPEAALSRLIEGGRYEILKKR